MFRRKVKPKTNEHHFPADLKQLGLFLNDNGELRKLDNHDEKFEYYMHGSKRKLDQSHPIQRLNERRREAIDECLRRESLTRLERLGVKIYQHPEGVPSTTPHVRYLATPNLHTARRILFIAPDPFNSALGMFSLREATDNSVTTGSMEAFIRTALSSGLYDGFLISNPAAIWWDPLTLSAMSQVSFRARDKYAVSKTHKNPAVIDQEAHLIPGHTSPEAHIASILTHARTLFHKTCKPRVDFLAAGYSAYATIKFFAENWSEWEDNLHAGVLCESLHVISELPQNFFRTFLRERCRAYICSPEPMGTLIPAESRIGTSRFSSEQMHWAAIIPRCIELITAYFEAAKDAGDDADKQAKLNPDVPVIEGDDVDPTHYEKWKEAVQKLDLGKVEEGWDVEGSKELMEFGKKVGIIKTAEEEEEELPENEWRRPDGTTQIVPDVPEEREMKAEDGQVPETTEVEAEDVKLPETPEAELEEKVPETVEVEAKDVKLPETPDVEPKVFKLLVDHDENPKYIEPETTVVEAKDIKLPETPTPQT